MKSRPRAITHLLIVQLRRALLARGLHRSGLGDDLDRIRDGADGKRQVSGGQSLGGRERQVLFLQFLESVRAYLECVGARLKAGHHEIARYFGFGGTGLSREWVEQRQVRTGDRIRGLIQHAAGDGTGRGLCVQREAEAN